MLNAIRVYYITLRCFGCGSNSTIIDLHGVAGAAGLADQWSSYVSENHGNSLRLDGKQTVCVKTLVVAVWVGLCLRLPYVYSWFAPTVSCILIYRTCASTVQNGLKTISRPRCHVDPFLMKSQLSAGCLRDGSVVFCLLSRETGIVRKQQWLTLLQ